MEYEIKIVMYGENKDYEKQLEAIKERNRYRDYQPQHEDYPQKMIPVKCLETRVNEEQFEAIRKAALEVF